MEFLLFFPILTKGIKAKLNELESESNVFLQNEGKDGKSELTPVVKALTNCAMLDVLAGTHCLFDTAINKCSSLSTVSPKPIYGF